MAYSEQEQRDDHGRWTSGGGGADKGASHQAGVHAVPTGDNASKTPAQDLLNKNVTGKETLGDIESKLTPSQKQKISDAEDEIRGKPTTKSQFTDASGRYTPEREKLHDAILAKVLSKDKMDAATPKPGVKPTLTVTGGRAASGKTSTLKNELKDVTGHALGLNPDEMQEHLPGYNGRNAAIYHDEAADLAGRAEAIARAQGKNVIYDATMKTQKTTADRIDAYKQAGYDVDGYFVHTTPTESAIRSVKRFEGSGRYVPPAYSFNSRTNEATFDSIIPKFRNWSVYDNNGASPKRVAHGKNY